MTTDVLPTVTETDVFTALRAFILTLVGCEVIRGQVNQAAMPVGDFIVLTALGSEPLETNTDQYTATTKTILRPTQWRMQVDCYGAVAGDRAQTIASLLRDNVACDSFAASGFDIAPLYAGDAKQMPLITGEEQFLERWTFEAVLQTNPVVTVAVDTADILSISITNVPVQYPA